MLAIRLRSLRVLRGTRNPVSRWSFSVDGRKVNSHFASSWIFHPCKVCFKDRPTVRLAHTPSYYDRCGKFAPKPWKNRRHIIISRVKSIMYLIARHAIVVISRLLVLNRTCQLSQRPSNLGLFGKHVIISLYIPLLFFRWVILSSLLDRKLRETALIRR